MTILNNFFHKEMRKYLFLIPGIAMVFSSLVAVPVQAQGDLEGKVIKVQGHNTLYMVADGERLVFPSEKIYRSWFSDFNGVVEISGDQVRDLPLRGNVRYRPGVLMVKLQTDPKVYAVGQNGQLRWVKSEALARKLYGDHWNMLIDDVSDAFFANYNVDEPVDEEGDFDPGDEEEFVSSIADNRLTRIKEKFDKTVDRICNRLERRLNHLQERLAKRGIQVDGLGSDFTDVCLFDDGKSGDDEKEIDDVDKDEVDHRRGRDRDGKRDKVLVCHKPDKRSDKAKTLEVGKAAARAHVAHGDKLGRCDRVTDQEPDTTPPVISEKKAEARTTSALITWLTNEESTSGVLYAKESLATASTTKEAFKGNLVKNHEIVLGDLMPDTEYFYVVRSADHFRNAATSTEMSFTTLPVVDATTTSDTL